METTERSRTLKQDGGLGTYECGPGACGYDGETYCQECGYGRGER